MFYAISFLQNIPQAVPEQKVRIEDPRHPDSAVTSQKRASRLVRNGHAVYTAPFGIRFVEVDRTAAGEARQRDQARVRLTGQGYDAVRSQFRAYARNIPVIHPELIKV